MIIKYLHLFSSIGQGFSRLSPKRSEVIELKIGEHKLKMNASHDLPQILRTFPNYAWNLARLTKTVKAKYKEMIAIDVGANVGDSAAFMRTYEHFPIVCIEGDSEYFSFLTDNVRQFSNIYTYKYFLGDRNGEVNGELEKKSGTLRILDHAKGSAIPIITLDKFTKTNPQFRQAKFLKIDTDGYDMKVISGGFKYIAETKPVLFFEYDNVFLSATGDIALKVLLRLERLGYEKIIFYDNYGRFILSSDLGQHQILTQLDNYINGRHGAFPYFDICLFHKEDRDVANKFIVEEMKFYGIKEA